MKTEKVLFILETATILALLTAALLSDDNLNHEPGTWLQTANYTEDVEGNGYYYLLGIAAGEADDPRAFGRWQLALYREAETGMLESGADRIDFSLEKPLPLPDGDYYCHVNEGDCYPRLANHPEDLESELAKHRVLLDRYHAFFGFPALKTLITPAYYEVFPPYEYIARGNKLNQFRIMLDAAHGKRAQALEALQHDIRNIRKHLTIADNLIYKLVLAHMLADDLDLLAGLIDPEIDAPLPALGLLTREERSMHRPMIHEFGMTANLFLNLDDRTGLSDEEPAIPKSAVRFLFKPNMSANDAFRRLQRVEKLSLLPLPAFYQTVSQNASGTGIPFSLRNYAGWVLNSIGTVDPYPEYLSRVNNIDCKIALINAALPLGSKQWLNIMKGSSDAPDIENPYNPQEPPYADKETQSLCFKGPYEDERGYRCVKKHIDSAQTTDLQQQEPL